MDDLLPSHEDLDQDSGERVVGQLGHMTADGLAQDLHKNLREVAMTNAGQLHELKITDPTPWHPSTVAAYDT